MKKLILCAALLLCVCMLSSCTSGKNNTKYQVVDASETAAPQNLYNSVAPLAEEDDYDFDMGGYDPMSEEEDESEMDPVDESVYAAASQSTPAPTIRSDYAGATPVIIDPIDKPTPTPIPALTFTFTTYTASKLHLTFQAPEGWEIDDKTNDTYTLTSTDNRTGYRAFITVRSFSVNETFKSSEMKTEVRQTLNTIATDYQLKKFSTSSTANRNMLGKSGTYANYSGITTDGISVAGRVHMVCIDKTMYLLHVSYPAAYRDTYVDQVYHKVRDTLQVVK